MGNAMRNPQFISRLQISLPICASILIMFSMLVASASGQQSQKDTAAAGDALNSIFDVMRAPPAKSMGLLQGNFLDAVKSDGALQIALVIDTTESMADQIVAIRENLPKMVDDLRKLTDGNIEIAIVSYSDAGNESAGVNRLTQGFIKDILAIKAVITQLKTQSGAPYFPESVDLGIHHALNDLPWSDDANVTRWIMLFGDAPPYDSAFADTDTKARRLYENEVLVDTANQKNINIHCLLCNSRDKEKEAFETMLENTRAFMSRISSETGGLMLDMSYADVRQQLRENARRSQPESVRIGFITQDEIEAARANAPNISANEEKLKVAVLPMMSLDRISFFHEKPEVQLATELRQLFKLAPQTRLVNPRQIETELKRIKSEGLPIEQWGQALCYRLRADIVLTGRMSVSGDQSRVVMQPFARNASSPLSAIDVSSRSGDLAKQLIAQIGAARTESTEYGQLSARMKKLADEQKIDQSDIGILATLDPESKALLLSGLEALEQALGYSLGEPNGKSLLDVAENKLIEFVNLQPKQPFVHALLASCRYNQAKALETMGFVEDMKVKFSESVDSIKQAYSLRNQLLDGLTRLEIEGDYNLMVRQEYESAIEKYSEMINQDDASPLNRALRAHWMIAGIRAGDWQGSKPDPSVVDLEQARQHLIQILAFWPDSVEAQKIKKSLHWDARKDKSRTPFFPKEGDVLAAND